MSFLRRMAGFSLRDEARSSVIYEGLRVPQLLLCTERSQLRWFGQLVRMPPGRRPREQVLVSSWRMEETKKSVERIFLH